MHLVYAIYNKKHDKIYIGQCENLSLRLRLHNNKTFKNSYTAKFDDVWSLIYKEETANRQEALKREKQLKSFKGREFIKKIFRRSAMVAQLTVNQLVVGSNPTAGAKFKKASILGAF